MPIRYTNACCSRQKRSFDAACRAASAGPVQHRTATPAIGRHQGRRHDRLQSVGRRGNLLAHPRTHGEHELVKPELKSSCQGTPSSHRTACKAALAAIVANRPRTSFIDYRTDNKATRDPNNFVDPIQYRARLADKITEGVLASLMASARKCTSSIRLKGCHCGVGGYGSVLLAQPGVAS